MAGNSRFRVDFRFRREDTTMNTISIKKADGDKLAVWLDYESSSLLWDYVEVQDIVGAVMAAYQATR